MMIHKYIPFSKQLLRGHIGLIAPSSFSTQQGYRYFSNGPVLADKRAVLGQKILNMVPRFLKPYTINFINKPVSNLTSFLILHELTAIVPLIGIWYLFHEYQISVPLDLPQWAIEKGTRIIDDSMKSYDFQDWSLNDKFRLITEGAYAFVLVKFLLPVRLVFSFLLTPWFTKFIIDPITRMFKRKPKEVNELKEVKQENLKKIEKPRL